MKKTNPRTEEQRIALIKRMILNNPMKNPQTREKVSNSKRGKMPPNPFPKNNQFWKNRKDLALNNENEIPQTTTENTLNIENENKKIPQTDG